jgi:periplasmic protein TonB
MTGEDRFSRFVVTSAAVHAALGVFILVSPALFAPEASEVWGNTDGSIKVGVVGSLPVPGLQLPSPAVVHENVPPAETKSLHPPEPAPKPQPKVAEKPDVLIPSKAAPTKVTPAPPAPSRAPTKTEVADATNAVPTPGGGQAAAPYGQAGSGSGPATIGDESFGVRYGEYVRAMTTAIREKWQQAGGPRTVPRVYVTFKIARDGTVSNVALEQSSGSVLQDNAALRAVQSATMPPLPRDYLKGSIDVRFYFEYVR